MVISCHCLCSIGNVHMIAELIKRRRLQILVHSAIYYDFDRNIIDDATWSKWASELVDLQSKHPDISETVILHDEFKDFDGSTGFNLPTHLVESQARYLLKLRGDQV